jgi:hypothetical protein
MSELGNVLNSDRLAREYWGLESGAAIRQEWIGNPKPAHFSRGATLG